VDEAIRSLNALIERPDLPFSGWTIPIEPLLERIHEHEDFQRVTAKLAQRAR
jgi:hypothetical protein